MKTLDEVIAELEDEKVFADALYYLQMYRSDMKMYADNQKYWEDELKQKIKDFGDAKDRYIKRLKELDIGTLNDPLTWDELKSMEGKPVWVEGEHGCIWNQKAWSLIHLDVENDDIVICVSTDNGVHYEFAIDKEDYGKAWQAYRKERNENAR